MSSSSEAPPAGPQREPATEAAAGTFLCKGVAVLNAAGTECGDARHCPHLSTADLRTIDGPQSSILEPFDLLIHLVSQQGVIDRVQVIYHRSNVCRVDFQQLFFGKTIFSQIE